MEKENIRDYLNRLNGYARNANIKFENGGRNAREHVKHFLETCGDKDLEHIYTLEDVGSDIWKMKKRVAGRESSTYVSGKDETRYGDSRNSYGRNGSRNHSHDRSRSEPRSTRVALADATLSMMIRRPRHLYRSQTSLKMQKCSYRETSRTRLMKWAALSQPKMIATMTQNRRRLRLSHDQEGRTLSADQ
ncbi:hypothetical protein PHMEG_00024886 [Phytophthora megakarya]|uniref:Uncharacterized protein n=1 Tax=Phytophthora megakarya TaxID=4795 RepID=A0A225VDK4_9STRA|nr:hypothetical protein PHMEG_00024886 [Phytophthora megakarya]